VTERTVYSGVVPLTPKKADKATVPVAVFLCDRCVEKLGPRSEKFFVGYLARHDLCRWCAGMATTAFRSEVSDPMTISWGPVPSSGVTLMPYRPHVWDVNGYYNSLGVLPWASRREIREAYQALDGQSDERLTYIAKVLLNRDTRRDYDAVPLGRFYLDRYVIDRIRKAEVENARVAQEAGYEVEMDDSATPESVEERIRDEYESDSQELDDRSETRQTVGIDGWPWRLHAWQYCPDLINEMDTIRRWQQVLGEAMRECGQKRRFSVGLHALDSRACIVQETEEGPVFYLRVGADPTEETAEAVVLNEALVA
jgi:hypothetical protein